MKYWCPWCKRTYEPDLGEWVDKDAVIPPDAYDRICYECKLKLYKENGVTEEEVETV